MSNLYNKYNPRNFQDVIGQDFPVKILKTISKRANIPNGIILSGIHGIGKTLLARVFSKAINCLEVNKPCDKCTNCEIINKGSEDIIEVDGATYTGVDNIRKLLENSNYLPMSLKYKVYIIDEVHMLSRSAFDALLMTLQEPPKYIKFLFATTKPDKLPDTFLSRCISIHLTRVNNDNIFDLLKNILLKEGKKISDERVLNIICDVSEGSVRRAISLLELVLILGETQEITYEEIFNYLKILSTEECLNIFESILNGETLEAIEKWRNLYNKGYDEKSFMHKMSEILTNLSLLKLNENNSIRNSIRNREIYEKILENYNISLGLLTKFWEILIRQTEAMYIGFAPLVENTLIMFSLTENDAILTSDAKKIFSKL